MAILLDKTSSFGTNHLDAYGRIFQVELKNGPGGTITLHWYVDEAARRSGKVAFEANNFAFTEQLVGEPIVWAYNWLKQNVPNIRERGRDA